MYYFYEHDKNKLVVAHHNVVLENKVLKKK